MVIVFRGIRCGLMAVERIESRGPSRARPSLVLQDNVGACSHWLGVVRRVRLRGSVVTVGTTNVRRVIGARERIVCDVFASTTGPTIPWVFSVREGGGTVKMLVSACCN